MKVPQIAKPTGRFERIGFWIIVAAAVVVLVVLAGFVLGPIWAALWSGLVFGLFATLITAVNLSALADPTNRVLGRRLFPVVQGGDRVVTRLMAVNGTMMFAFAFLFEWIRTALHLGSLFSAILVLVLVGVVATVISRARNAVGQRRVYNIGETPKQTIDINLVETHDRTA